MAGQSATHEHEVYDWSDVKDDKLMRYMTRLTEPGATKMWDGWFTTYWRPILTDMIQRQQPNRSAARAYDIATKAAKNIRLTIKTGLHDMWKIRNEIKFDRQTKERPYRTRYTITAKPTNEHESDSTTNAPD